MHRSGTSAITYALTILVINLGNKLYPQGFDNPKGFWEDKEVIKINNKLLSYMNSKYDQLDFAWDHFKNNSKINNLKLEAKKFLTKRLNESDGIYGFKDPRTCRLINFWKEIFQCLGCNVSYIICIRNPMSVVKSLKKRNNIAEEKSYILWLQHTIPAVICTNGCNRIVINYDSLIDQPYKQLERLSHALGLSLPSRNTETVIKFEKEFLSLDLRHSMFSFSELLQNTQAPKSVAKIYKILLSVSKDVKNLDSTILKNTFKKLSSELEAFTSIFSYSNTLEKKILNQHKDIASLNEKIVDLNQALSNRNKKIAELNHSLNKIHNSKAWVLIQTLRKVYFLLRGCTNNFYLRTSIKKNKNNNNSKKY